MRGHRVLYVQYGSILFVHPDSGTIPTTADEPEQPGGVVHPDTGGRGGFVLMTGTFFGPVDLTIETFDAEPPAAPGRWEQTEEHQLTSGGLNLVAGTGTERLDDFPRLFVNPGDRYRVRLYSRGVEQAREQSEPDEGEPVVEYHRVELWRE